MLQVALPNPPPRLLLSPRVWLIFNHFRALDCDAHMTPPDTTDRQETWGGPPYVRALRVLKLLLTVLVLAITLWQGLPV